MRYNYECKTCDEVVEVNKPMKESSRAERCPKCKLLMTRVYNIGGILTGDGFKR